MVVVGSRSNIETLRLRTGGRSLLLWLRTLPRSCTVRRRRSSTLIVVNVDLEGRELGPEPVGMERHRHRSVEIQHSGPVPTYTSSPSFSSEDWV